jgi:hypothetical protein
MRERIEAYARELANFKTDFKTYIADKSLPLEQRWNDFEFAVEKDIFVDVKSYYWDSPTLTALGFDSYYDDFNLERYSTMTFTDMIEHLGPAYKDEPVSEENINIIKEEMLASGYSGFEYDW